MNPHEKLQALIGEFSEEYVLVARVDGKLTIAASDPDFAESIIPELEECIAETKLKNDKRSKKHHHDPNRKKKETDGDDRSCQGDYDK